MNKRYCEHCWTEKKMTRLMRSKMNPKYTVRLCEECRKISKRVWKYA